MSSDGIAFGSQLTNSAAPSRPVRGSAGDIHALKERDNVTNWRFLALVYLVIVTTIALTLWSYQIVAEAGLGWWWNIPVTMIAIVAIGASQHQFGGVVHEATHYILFANRKMNELVSDWLAAFPIYTSTYAFRLHHLAHHQFVNDPVRDPNFNQALESGHWLDFPVAHVELLMGVLRLLWPPSLVKYIMARARHSAIGTETNPYADPDRPGRPFVTKIGILFVIGVPVLVVTLVELQQWGWAAFTLFASWASICLYYWLVPASAFPQSRIDPVIPHRMTAIGRMTFLAILYSALTIAGYATGAPTWGYFALLWILPLFTTFPVFMIVREWIQHGNADRGRLTNSRVFLVDPISRYAVLPFGMDYHLPHHLFASVPHYKLKELHALLQQRDPEYASKGVVVEGWISSPDATNGRPTAVDVLGPAWAQANKDIHVDEATLELAEVNNREAIKAQIEQSRHVH